MDLIGLFDDVYVGRRVLVTGHTGFKGSWLVFWLRAMGAQVAGLALDPDTTPAHWHLLALDDIVDHRVDLRDPDGVRAVLENFRPEIVFHLAAQPLVRRSYRQPVNTFDVNVMGLINLYEVVRACPSVRVVVNATTDKVYEDRVSESGYRESDPLGGHDPYSSSKACAEVVSACYRQSFFDRDDGRGFAVRLATARAGNVIGGGDWAEDRLVPDLVRAAHSKQPMKIRHPGAIRPWQHVLDPLSGYLRLGEALIGSERYAEAWNFGPDCDDELTVQELASRLHVGWPALRVEHDGDAHPHEAEILRLDCSKAKQLLAWRPVWDMDTGIKRTASWYRDFHDSGYLRTADDLAAYVGDARRSGLGWAN